MIKEKLSPELNVVLVKMCDFVEANYVELDLDDPSWYLKYEWSLEKENEFKKWLIDYLKKNKPARLELMKHPSTTKAILEKFAEHFVFNYGWKIK